MTNIVENLSHIKGKIPQGVSLVAVSKTKPMVYIEEAYNAGQRIFGENKALELRDKYYALPKDIQWHFIGHLQTNKIKYIAPFVSLIHSIDSESLLKEVNKYGKKNNRVIPCLLQFYIAKEDTKYGFLYEEALEMLQGNDYKDLKNIQIVGVMGMATYTEDKTQIKQEFASLKTIFDNLKSGYFKDDASFCEISMGMSDDFEIAIEEGSSLVRVGSSIFGPRVYL